MDSGEQNQEEAKVEMVEEAKVERIEEAKIEMIEEANIEEPPPPPPPPQSKESRTPNMSEFLNPLELLENKDNRDNTFLFDKYNPLAGGLFGFGLGCVLNFGFRKPVFSGIQKHLGFSMLGTALGCYYDKARNEYLARRDAVLRHYVELHPDDFPSVRRKKYAEILEPWTPIR